MGALITVTIGFIVLACLCLFYPDIAVLAFALLGIGIVLFAIYATVKKAVKDALWEYDEEKAKANGQK